MAKKGLGDLVPDIKNALGQSMKNVAYKVTKELKREGPYWTGQFEKHWFIETGDVGIGAFKVDESYDIDGVVWYNGDPYPEPASPEYTEPFVPPPDGLKGYTIGNVMSYRDGAMDLTDTTRRGQKRYATAPQDWFTNYYHGPMIGTVYKAVDEVMKNEGFK